MPILRPMYRWWSGSLLAKRLQTKSLDGSRIVSHPDSAKARLDSALMQYGLGELDDFQGVVERNGQEVARVELGDDRVQETIVVRMASCSEGKYPGRIHGAVSICFLENN